MPENSPQSQAGKPSRTKDYKAHLLERGSYTAKPNELELAWLDGSISTHCYRLITLLIVHADEYTIWRTTLENAFKNNATLKVAIDEALSRNMITRSRKNRNTPYQYYINHCKLWDLQAKSEPKISEPKKSEGQKSEPQKSAPITRRTLNKTNLNKKKEEEVRGLLPPPNSLATLSSKEESQNSIEDIEMRNLREEFQALKKEDPPKEKPKPEEVYGVELKAIGPQDCKTYPLPEKKANGLVWGLICSQEDRNRIPALMRQRIFDMIKEKNQKGEIPLLEVRLKSYLTKKNRLVLIDPSEATNLDRLNGMIDFMGKSEI